MILNRGAPGGSEGLRVIASGERAIESIVGTDIVFERPATVVFLLEIQFDDTSAITCLPTGTSITSSGATKYTLSADGTTLSVRPQYSDAFDIEYLALG